MIIIPAIDIIDGKCVRLSQGNYDQKKIYSENPLEVAKGFEQSGLRNLHLVDLDGAKAGRVTNWDVVRSIAAETNLRVDFGGGVKTKEEIQKLFDYGVRQVNLGSIAVRNRELVFGWIKEFGADKIILSADVKDEMVAISGWTEDSSILLNDFIQDFRKKGIQYVTCTDISTDGMLAGPNIALYRKLNVFFPGLRIIASGGVSSLDDLRKLRDTGVYGAIVGKAIYEQRITLQELQDF
jgi:phosphoribosylformimino-5-aminoimidazole carboxamide ribotide isomerase